MNYLRNRAVVTGVGVVAPNGVGTAPFWESLVAGRSAIRRISRFPVEGLKSQIAGEVPDFDPSQWVDPRHKAQRKGRHSQFAMCAAAMALEDAGVNFDGGLSLSHPLPVIMGAASTHLEMVQETVGAVTAKGPRQATPLLVSEASPSAVAGSIAQLLDIPVATRTLSTACAAGADAISEAVEIIRRGEADMAMAGGSDSPLSVVPFANFDMAGMASRANTDPGKASRPFDKRRDTGVISEGCAVLVIENLESALARGATPYLEVMGTGHQTDFPGKICSGLEGSMRKALANGSLLAGDVDYVCAWAPGHPVIDRVETELIKRVFGAHAKRLAVSSIKGVTGNPLAAAGPLMLAACCMAFRHELIPPTANYEEPDPQCDLDCVPNHARKFRIQNALLNSHGMGGTNISIALGRV